MNRRTAAALRMLAVAWLWVSCVPAAHLWAGEPVVEVYRYARQKPVGIRQVEIGPGFWKPRIDRSRDVGVLDYLEKFEEHGYIDNFRIVADGREAKHNGGPNNNEFVYKLMEAMGWYADDSRKIARALADVGDTVLAAQREDGYLNTFYDNPVQKRKGRKRFQPDNRFEFYDFGHFAQAAVAHWRTTGDDRLLKAAVRFADLIVRKFADPNDLPYTLYRGPVNQKYEHPNHELAMVDLYRVTGDRRYVDFVRQTLEEYGFFGPKFNEIWGHAVQETLLYAGAADLYLETGAEDVWQVVVRLWRDMHDRKMYIIGGVGSTGRGEAYGKAYDLPNASAYCETCAAVSLVFWNHKMLLATGDPTYADAMERSLYNNVLSGISLAGTEYFYRNPLAWDPARPVRAGRRNPWFGCSCCPPNVHRLLASFQGYIYTRDAGGVQVNLYTGSTLRHTLPGGARLTLTQRTDYPWRGDVEVRVALDRPAEFTLSLRVPGWCRGATVAVNGKPLKSRATADGYLRIDRRWADGDTVALHLPMVPRVVLGDPRVEDQVGRLAILRGPVVYCLEQIDVPEADLDRLVVPKDVTLMAHHEPDLLGGVVTITGRGEALDGRGGRSPVTLRAIPYYAWANREPAAMRVWLAHDPAILSKPKSPTIASRSRASVSFWNKGQRNLSPAALNDQAVPRRSSDPGVLWFHWWPHLGSTEWVQYDFAEPATVSAVEVYWFDDTGRGNCRVPASWRLLYRTGDGWKEVPGAGTYGVARDRFNHTAFLAVKTSGLRIEASLRKGFSSGVLEWRVHAAE